MDTFSMSMHVSMLIFKFSWLILTEEVVLYGIFWIICQIPPRNHLVQERRIPIERPIMAGTEGNIFKCVYRTTVRM